MENQHRYFDFAAAVPPDAEALATYTEISSRFWANPSSMYADGKRAGQILAQARKEIAERILCRPEELFFTGGGTESINWAIRSAASVTVNRRTVLCCSDVHPAVLETVKSLAKQGYAVRMISPDAEGLIPLDAVAQAVDTTTALLCLSAANNETGVQQALPELSDLVHKHGAYVLADAVQLPDSVCPNCRETGADFMSFSGHKFGAVRGTGLLYVKTGTLLSPMLYGGGQQNGKRSGTEDVAGAACMAIALKNAVNRWNNASALAARRNRFEEKLLRSIPNCRVNGTRRLPGFSNLTVDGVAGESLVLLADLKGFCLSTASACHAGKNLPSDVLLSMGRTKKEALESIRISFSDRNTEKEIAALEQQLPEMIKQLRQLSL